jgi:hypothetical protein
MISFAGFLSETPAGPGRPKIINQTLVTADGGLLRGMPVNKP